MDAGPVKDILGPAVTASRNDSEHVFHAQRNPGPVMRLHLWHGYDEIGRKNSSGQPEVAQAGIVGLKLGFDEVVAIQIDELDLAMQKLIGETRFVHQEFCVPMMAGAFGDGYGSGSKSEEAIGCGADQLCVRVYGFSRYVLDNIGLEQDRFSADVQIKKAETLVDQTVEPVRILICM